MSIEMNSPLDECMFQNKPPQTAFFTEDSAEAVEEFLKRCSQVETDRPDILPEGNDRQKYEEARTDEGFYKCFFPGCTMLLKNKGRLKRHQRTHSDERPFKCSVAGCPAAYKSKSGRRFHEKRHMGGEPVACLMAPRNYAATRTDEGPLKCSFEACGATFKSRSGKKYHELKHTGEEAFVCLFEGCSKKYSRKDCLRRHQINHGHEPKSNSASLDQGIES
jgi:uncharacterized Zn-finger protein